MTDMKKAIVIKGDDIPEKDFDTVKTKVLLDTEEVPNFSVNWVYKKKSDKMSTADKGDIAYYILSGTGNAIINNKTTQIKKGDVIYIPKGEEYKISEGIETLAVCNPRFGGKKEINYNE